MSAELDQALQVRRRARSRRRNRRCAAVAVGLLVLAALAWLVCLSPVLVVRDVEVTGTVLTTADDVRAAAAVPVGTPLVRLDGAVITGRVEQLATVADARLVRSWPSTVRIEVTERSAVYQIEADGGYGQVDASGVVFTTAPERSAVPVAALADVGDQKLRAAVAAAMGALPQDVRERLDSVSAGSTDSISFLLGGGTTIFWGSAEQSAEKASVIEVLLARGEGYMTYDVSAPSRPAAS